LIAGWPFELGMGTGWAVTETPFLGRLRLAHRQRCHFNFVTPAGPARRAKSSTAGGWRWFRHGASRQSLRHPHNYRAMSAAALASPSTNG
jgi:hypothetical protein